MVLNFLYGPLKCHIVIWEYKNLLFYNQMEFFQISNLQRTRHPHAKRGTNRLNPEPLLTFDCFWITVAMTLASQTITQDVACFAFACFKHTSGYCISLFGFHWAKASPKHTPVKSMFGFLSSVVCHCGASLPQLSQTAMGYRLMATATGEWHKTDPSDLNLQIQATCKVSSVPLNQFFSLIFRSIRFLLLTLITRSNIHKIWLISEVQNFLIV